MRVLENYELDLVAGGDRWGAEPSSPSNLLRDMGKGAADGAAAVLLVKGAGWIREELKMLLF